MPDEGMTMEAEAEEKVEVEDDSMGTDGAPAHPDAIQDPSQQQPQEQRPAQADLTPEQQAAVQLAQEIANGEKTIEELSTQLHKLQDIAQTAGELAKPVLEETIQDLQKTIQKAEQDLFPKYSEQLSQQKREYEPLTDEKAEKISQILAQKTQEQDAVERSIQQLEQTQPLTEADAQHVIELKAQLDSISASMTREMLSELGWNASEVQSYLDGCKEKHLTPHEHALYEVGRCIQATGEGEQTEKVVALKEAVTAAMTKTMESRGFVGEDGAKHIEEAIDNMNIPQPRKDWMKKQLTLAGVLAGDAISQTDVATLIEFFMTGHAMVGHFGEYNHVRRSGEAAVGEKQIDQAYPTAKDALVGLEDILLNYSTARSPEVHSLIQGMREGKVDDKFAVTENGKIKKNEQGESELDFMKYKKWLVKQFTTFINTDQDNVVKEMQERQFEHGLRKVVVEKAGKKEWKAIEKPEELIQTKEGIEHFIELAMSAKQEVGK